MAKKRTTAQRRAAAKEAWRLRRLREAEKPSPVPRELRTSDKLPKIDIVDLGAELAMPPIEGGKFVSPKIDYPTPTTVAVSNEGETYYLSVSSNGSFFRHKVSRQTMRLLGLDALRIAG